MAETPEIQEHTHDVLVIGAGGAGLRAAIEASREGANTAVVCKSLLGKAHTVMAEGGAAAALRNRDPRDNWRVHMRDTIRGAKLLNSWKMAMIHAKESPDRIRELEQWGAVFDRTGEGWINQRNFGGHQYPRLAHVGDRTGLELIRTLQDYGIHQGLDVYMETTVVDLFRDGDRVAGAIAYERESGQLHVFRAKAVVLACGGTGKAYKVTSNSWEYAGDGFGMAYRIGAELIDMEFVQFHPTGMIWPPSARGILVTEGVRGEGGMLRNSDGERFMFDNVPEMFQGEYAETEEEGQRWLEGDPDARRPPELLTRDVVARAIRRQVQAGKGSPHGGAFLDISWRDPEYIKAKLPSMHHQFKELAGLDITQEPMEVGPTCHYIMGGVRVDPETQMTRVEGLFAAGETAGGLHGANRLGGNSLSDLLTFGRRAGLYAAKWAKDHDLPTIDQTDVDRALQVISAPFEREEGENPYELQEALQEIMNDHVGMIRDGTELEEGIQKLEALKERIRNVAVSGDRHFNPGWHTALDLRNLIIASEAIARAALQREESRGAHTRLDFPDTDKEYWGQVNSLVRRSDKQMVVTTEPKPEWPDEVRAIVEADPAEISSDPATPVTTGVPE